MNSQQVEQLYGVGDLAAALKVPHGYVTPLLNRGVFSPTHRWGRCRLFTRDRLDQIVREHGALIRAGSFLNGQPHENGNVLPSHIASACDEA
jgi:hypothetical protein